MIPVIVYDQNTTLPETGTYYIIAKEGIFLHKEMPLLTATVQVDRISPLQSVTRGVSLRLPKIPAIKFAEIVAFFRRVYVLYRAEAIVLLYFNKEKEEFILEAPRQKVSGSHIDYDPGVRIEGCQLVGTVHSHANMAAYHSGTDHSDEANFDGLHVTVGHLGEKNFSLSSEIVVNDNRFKIEHTDVIENIRSASVEEEGVIKGKVGKMTDKLSRYFDPPMPYAQNGFYRRYSSSRLTIDGFEDSNMIGFPEAWLRSLEEISFPNRMRGLVMPVPPLQTQEKK